MPTISILPVQLRNKIAAGEVIERPASVVKELVENAIDAGSTKISIEILRAGKRLIKVSDNGRGMDRDDALVAFERYSTSKLKEESDLFNIRTMGFRGEALSSIASVAKVSLSTAPDAMSGTCVELIGGEVKATKECSALGTTIEVRDLFFNTPARLKFLKSESTENYHIIDLVTKEALSHFSLGFLLRMDGSEVLNLPSASGYKERILQVFGKEFLDGLLESTRESGRMRVQAYFGNESMVRNNRNNQFVFVNKRPVKDQTVTHAVYKAYEGIIPKEKHPVFLLFLEIDPRIVDFNVHPAKREVRFTDKNAVFNLVYHAAREVRNIQAQEIINQAPSLAERSPQEIFENAHRVNYEQVQPHAFPSGVFENLEIPYQESIPFLYLGETFVAVADAEGLTIIDYHAAHERVNYERILKKLDLPLFTLLFPRQVQLARGEYKVIIDNIQMLHECGLEIEDFGNGSIIVRSLPDMLRDADVSALMSDIASSLLNKDIWIKREGVSDETIAPLDTAKKTIAARMACHSSIRGKSEAPDGARIVQLLKDLSLAEDPGHCPHGRPTRYALSLSQLRKLFKRE